MSSHVAKSAASAAARKARIVVPVRGRVRRLHLSDARERTLERVAREMGVTVETPDGSPAAPGWRALVYAIGEGLLRVVPAGPGPIVVQADRRCPGEWDE